MVNLEEVSSAIDREACYALDRARILVVIGFLLFTWGGIVAIGGYGGLLTYYYLYHRIPFTQPISPRDMSLFIRLVETLTFANILVIAGLVCIAHGMKKQKYVLETPGVGKMMRALGDISIPRLILMAFSLAGLVGLVLPWWTLKVDFQFGVDVPIDTVDAYLWTVVKEGSYHLQYGERLSPFVVSVAFGPVTTLSLALLILSSLIPVIGNLVYGRRERTFLLLQASCIIAMLALYFWGLVFNLAGTRIPIQDYSGDYLVGVKVFDYTVFLQKDGGSYVLRTWLSTGFWYTMGVLITPLVAFVAYSKMDKNRRIASF